MTATASDLTTAGRPTAAMLAGFNHVAVLVRDLDHWIEFWTTIFDTTFDEVPDERGRHGFLSLDARGMSVLHAFEIPTEMSGGPFPENAMFRRGRLDHFGVGLVDEASLLEIRDRLVARGASDGSIRLWSGRVYSVFAVDPEGLEFEIGCFRTGDVIGEGQYEIGH